MSVLYPKKNTKLSQVEKIQKEDNKFLDDIKKIIKIALRKTIRGHVNSANILSKLYAKNDHFEELYCLLTRIFEYFLLTNQESYNLKTKDGIFHTQTLLLSRFQEMTRDINTIKNSSIVTQDNSKINEKIAKIYAIRNLANEVKNLVASTKAFYNDNNKLIDSESNELQRYKINYNNIINQKILLTRELGSVLTDCRSCQIERNYHIFNLTDSNKVNQSKLKSSKSHFRSSR